MAREVRLGDRAIVKFSNQHSQIYRIEDISDRLVMNNIEDPTQKIIIKLTPNRLHLININTDIDNDMKRDRNKDMDSLGGICEIKFVGNDDRQYKLRVITFNLGTNVQKNVVGGSEKNMVERCQLQYSRYNGFADPSISSLSQCSFNAIEYITMGFLLKNNLNVSGDSFDLFKLTLDNGKAEMFNLIGLQECTLQYLSELLFHLNGDNDRYKSMGDGSVQIVYDSDILGDGILLSDQLYMIEKHRIMIIGWFPDIKLLCVNLHAPHDVDLIKVITETFNLANISNTIKPDRIIMMGDFNDSYRDGLKEISLMGCKLRQPIHWINKNNLPPKSCCDDVDYIFQGDYIFDSNKPLDENKFFYGIPFDTSDKDQILMSDHYPVVYIE